MNIESIRQIKKYCTEITLLAFITVYFQVNIHIPEIKSEQPAYHSISNDHIYYFEAQSSISIHSSFIKCNPFGFDLFNFTIDLPSIEVENCTAYSISNYLRNIFYTLTRIHAP